MRHRDDRHVAPDHRHHFARAIARCIHQILASGVAVVCSYAPLATRHSLDPDDAGEALDLRAEIARALGEGLGQLAGVDVAVERVVQAADNIVERDERVSLFDLVGRDDRKIDALRARHRATWAIFVHPIARVREADRAGDVIIDGIADPSSRVGVEPRRAALELMTFQLVEKFGQLPAACHVEPEVSSSRSISSASLQPRRARW